MRKDSALIMLGASAWPNAKNFQTSDSFARSARDVVGYFVTEFGLQEANLLDLFDNPTSPADQDREIYQFLTGRKNSIENLLIYYIGHGGFTPNNDYYLSLRCTSSWNPGVTSMRVLDLAKTLRECASHVRRFLILDACFSASAIPPFMSSPLQIAVMKTQEALPTRGTALLCSSGSRDPSKAPPQSSHTMFTGSLLEVLREGLPGHSFPMLNLIQVGELLEQRIFEVFADEAVRPEIHRPNQSSGDIAKVPIFPNPAAHLGEHSPTSARAPIKPKMPTGIANEEVAQAQPEDLFSRDAVRAFAAAESLIRSGAPIQKDFLTRLDFWSFVSEMAAERVVTARPELGKTLAEIATDRSLHYTVRITAADAFRPVHKSTAEPLVYEMYRSSLDGHFDDERIAIASLGRMGEDPGFADLICDGELGIPKSDYTFEKLNSFVIEALCWVFVNSVEGAWGAPSAYQVEKAWSMIVRRVRNTSAIESRIVRILSAGKPLHADVISEWLDSNSQDTASIAIQVLGQMGIKRLGRRVLQFARRAPDELIQPSYMAVSAIGTTEGIDFLEEQVRASTRPSSADFPLLLASHLIQDRARVVSILELLLDRDVFEKFHVWRIAGLKGLGEFQTQIVEALGSSEAVERGMAALALSRTDSRKHADRIEQVFRESSNNIEKILSSLAIIQARVFPLFDAALETLRVSLQQYSYGLRSQIRDDIVTVLTECGDRRISHLGKCWAEVYQNYPIRY